MTKLYEMLIKVFLKPLLMKGVMAVYDYFKEKKAARARKKASKIKLDAHKKAVTKEEKRKTFNEMP